MMYTWGELLVWIAIPAILILAATIVIYGVVHVVGPVGCR